MTIGIISDTHGLLRPEAMEQLQGVDHILHAGDVGKTAVLDELYAIAPVTAIKGNVDTSPIWNNVLRQTEAIELGGFWFYMVHSIQDLDIDPVEAGMHFVIFGHSHQPEQYVKDGVYYLNPGAAGHRRFSLPVTIAKVKLGQNNPVIEIVPLLS